MAEGEYFSVLAFFIVFREALEAAIVCAVLLGVLQETGQQHIKKWVWVGLAAGLLLTGAILVAVVITFQITSEGFSFRANKITQGVLSMSAAVLIGYMALTLGDLLDKRQIIEEKVKEAVEKAEAEKAQGKDTSTAEQVATGNDGGDKDDKIDVDEEDAEVVVANDAVLLEDDTWKTILFLSFTAVAREGFETIVFLGVGSGFEGKALPIPIFVGSLCGAVCGYLMYKASSILAIDIFLKVSVVFLCFVGAGIFMHGIFEFQEINDWGKWETVLWNISKCCSLRKPGWQLFRAVFGYTPYPTAAELFSYIMYWVTMLILFCIKWYVRRHDIDLKEKAKETARSILRRNKKAKVADADESADTDTMQEV